MKRNNTCVKCGRGELIRIPILPGEEPRITVGDRPIHEVEISRYVCGHCGYIEQWVENISDAAELFREYGNPKRK